MAYSSAEEMLFGTAKHTVTCCYDIEIGGGKVLLTRQEYRWPKKLDRAIKSLPENSDDLMSRLSAVYRDLFFPEEYGL